MTFDQLLEQIKEKGPIVLYHGTLRKNLDSIKKKGIEVNEGWGGYGVSGVFLSKHKESALYWAKLAYMIKKGEEMDREKFDRKYKEDVLAILEIKIPWDKTHNLKADMEQAEEYAFEGEPEDWKESLDIIGDVVYTNVIPPEWIEYSH